jgi:hypothetical protein
MQRPFELLSRRSMLVALATVLPVCCCFAEDFTVSSSDAEKAARDYLADLTAGEERGNPHRVAPRLRLEESLQIRQDPPEGAAHHPGRHSPVSRGRG